MTKVLANKEFQRPRRHIVILLLIGALILSVVWYQDLHAEEPATLIEIENEDPDYPDTLHLCQDSSDIEKPYLCFYTRGMPSENIVKSDRIFVTNCDLQIHLKINPQSGYEFLPGYFPVYRIDGFKFPNLNIVPSEKWRRYKIFRPRDNENPYERGLYFNRLSYNIKIDELNSSEIEKSYVNNSPGDLDYYARDRFYPLKDHEEKILKYRNNYKYHERGFSDSIKEWIDYRILYYIEKDEKNHLYFQKLLDGDMLYVEMMLSNGDVVEIKQPLKPLRDILLEKRPCGTDNDFDLLDEIAAEQR